VEPRKLMSEGWTRLAGARRQTGVFPLGRYPRLLESQRRLPHSVSGATALRRVAVKLIPTNRALAESQLPRWKRAGALAHPHPASPVGMGRVPTGRIALSVHRYGVRPTRLFAQLLQQPRPDGRRSARDAAADPGRTGVFCTAEIWWQGQFEAGKHPGCWRSAEAGKRHDTSRQCRHDER